MTLPENLILPYHLQQIKAGNIEDTTSNMKDLVKEIEKMYFDIVQRVNGQLKTSEDVTQANWTPEIYGASNAGTINHTTQDGVLLLKNNVLDVWFKIAWTTIGSGAGTLRIKIPYTIRDTNTQFWYGPLATNLTLSSGYTYALTSASNGNNYLQLIQCGSGVNIQNISIQANSQIRGHVRCLIENDR